MFLSLSPTALHPGRFGFSPGYKPALKLFIFSQAPRDRVGEQMSRADTQRSGQRRSEPVGTKEEVVRYRPWRVNRSLAEKEWMRKVWAPKDLTKALGKANGDAISGA